MNESSYGEYKRNKWRSQKRRENFHNGKIRFVIGICMLLYTLYLLPFHAVNAHKIRGDEMKAGKSFCHEEVYSVDGLRLLRAKTDADDGQLYCIAEFFDQDQNAWIISFTPGRNKQLAKQIRLAASSGNELDLTVSGYVLLEYLEDLPFETDSFYSVYGRGYAEAKGQKLLDLNAEYLCQENDNYTLQALLRPGIPFASLVVGVTGILSGGIQLIKKIAAHAAERRKI